MALRDDLIERISQAADMGRVYPYERFSNQAHKFKGLFVIDGKIRGGYVRRLNAHTTQHQFRHEQWELVLFQGWDDEGQSSNQFDDAIDALIDAFNVDSQVGDWRTLAQGEKTGWHLVKSQPVMVTNVLCHHATLRILLVT